jgi:hypothetical protein
MVSQICTNVIFVKLDQRKKPTVFFFTDITQPVEMSKKNYDTIVKFMNQKRSHLGIYWV